jgi:flagellar P-ring protein FlgI
VDGGENFSMQSDFRKRTFLMTKLTYTLVIVLRLCLSMGIALCTLDDVRADPVRVKDLGKLQGWRDNVLIGTGIVTGLAGTGDSPNNRVTKQALSNVLSQFNLSVAPDQIQSRNIAIVMVSASLPPFARQGDPLDISVTSAGDARSLVGGTLLLTPMKAVNGRIYALAQGGLMVGGYRYDSNGNVVQKNHPTVGSVPGGGVVEVAITASMVSAEQSITFVLNDPDYTTAHRIAIAINKQAGEDIARARDASGIDIAIPNNFRNQFVEFLSKIESLSVEPDRRAKVVINERTGTIVAGGDVRISKVAVTHGDIRIAITGQTTVSQPSGLIQPSNAIRTAAITNTRIDVDEQAGANFVTGATTVSDLVQSLVRLKMRTRDVISVLRAIKAAGALHAELVVQ